VDELTDDVITFLSEGTRTGKLGYTASDGRPLVAPIWFVVDNRELAYDTWQGHRREHRQRACAGKGLAS
jgi:hypothetical protein